VVISNRKQGGRGEIFIIQGENRTPIKGREKVLYIEIKKDHLLLGSRRNGKGGGKEKKFTIPSIRFCPW